MWNRTTLRPVMFFGALVLWATISFTGTKVVPDEEATQTGVALNDTTNEPEGDESDLPVRWEANFLPLAMRVEAETRILRLENLSAPLTARAPWATTRKADCRLTGRRSWLVEADRSRATDMGVLARAVQAHSPPARC